MGVRGEMFLAVLCPVVAGVTAVVPDWIGVFFRVDPDHGSRALEWEFVVALALAAVFAGALAWRDIRRLRAAR